MCVFGNVDIDCDSCPKLIKEICGQNFSGSLQDIIALAVAETRCRTLNEIDSYLRSIDDEEIERHYLRENDCFDSIINFRKDILEEIEIKTDDEILLKIDLENKIAAKENQHQMFTQESSVDIISSELCHNRFCGTCNKANVCKYREDTLHAFIRLKKDKDIPENIDILLCCKNWSGTVDNVR